MSVKVYVPETQGWLGDWNGILVITANSTAAEFNNRQEAALFVESRIGSPLFCFGVKKLNITSSFMEVAPFQPKCVELIETLSHLIRYTEED